MGYHFSKENDEFIQSIQSFKDVLTLCEVLNQDLGIIIWNKKREIIFVSNTINHIIDIQPSDLYGKKWLNIFCEKKLIHINALLDKNNENKTENVKIYYCHDDLVEYKLGYIKTYDDEYYYGQFKDISYITELEKQITMLQKGIIQTEKMAITGEFSAGIVHEIRNPLTSLKGFLQLVQAGIEQKEEYYQVMIQEIEKIESITTDLLTMAKPFNDNMETVLLEHLIAKTIIIMKLQNKFADITFKVNCREQISIFGNEDKIIQVLINLFKNASEAMDYQGNIIVNVIEENDTVQLEVIDEGDGLSEEDIYEISKPFYTTKESGTGLGLVITKYILDAHQATLKITSEKGNGSKFAIIFPKNAK